MRKKTGRKKIRMPLSWSIWSWIGTLLLACGIFALFFFKISRIGEPNPYPPFDPFEAAGFGILIALGGAFFLKASIIDRILYGIMQKRASGDIAKDIAKDVAANVVVGILDAATSSSGSSSRSSSSGGGTKGGGGDFGGGGASGDY